MAYEERGSAAAVSRRPHQLSLSDRKRLSIGGVTEVESFDEQEITLETDWGRLCIRGEGLNVSKLSVEGGDVAVEGRITELCYEDAAPKQGLWARLFR